MISVGGPLLTFRVCSFELKFSRFCTDFEAFVADGLAAEFGVEGLMVDLAGFEVGIA